MNSNEKNILTIVNISPARPTYFFSPTYRLTGWLGRTCEWIESPSRYCEMGFKKGGLLKVILIIPKIFASIGDGISYIVHRIAAVKIKDYDQQFDDFAIKCKGPKIQQQQLAPHVGKFIDYCIIHRISPAMFAEGQELLFLSDNANALSYLGNQMDGYYSGYCEHKFKNKPDYKCLWVLFFPQDDKKTNEEYRKHYRQEGGKLALGNKVDAMSFVKSDYDMVYSKTNVDYIKNQFKEFEQINPAEMLLNNFS